MMASIQLDGRQMGFGGIHGGHLAASALRVMAGQLRARRPPRSLTAALLASVAAGTLEIEAHLERDGGTISATSARLSQNGLTVGTAMALFGDAEPGPERLDRRMPDVPPPEDCQPLGQTPVPGSEGLSIEPRPAAPPLPLSGSDQARLVVWLRTSSVEPIDAATAVVLADGAVPALYGCLDAYVPIPTIELAVQFADLGAATDSPWLLGSFDHLHAADGYTVEDIELWAPTGQLVLTGRQLRRVLAAT